jgi:hypothetical protein
MDDGIQNKNCLVYSDYAIWNLGPMTKTAENRGPDGKDQYVRSDEDNEGSIMFNTCNYINWF